MRRLALLLLLAAPACEDKSQPVVTVHFALDAGALGARPAAPPPVDAGALHAKDAGALARSADGGSAARATDAGALAAAASTHCPTGMAPLPTGGCIDQYEASAGPGKVGAADGKGTTVVAVSAPGRKPLVNVSVLQAKAACLRAGKHLCDEHEWLAACRGRTDAPKPGEMYFPYGGTFEPLRCNDWRASDQTKKGTSPTGSFPKCATATVPPAFDLSGNVAELTASPEEDGRGWAARGGSYNNMFGDLSCEEDDYLLQSDKESAKDVGFRCCSAAK